MFQAEGENEVNNELANRISLFYADATPMLKTLSDGTTKFVSEVRPTGGGVFSRASSSSHCPCSVSVAEQEPAHREHDGLPQHHGNRVQSHAGNAVSYRANASSPRPRQ